MKDTEKKFWEETAAVTGKSVDELLAKKEAKKEEVKEEPKPKAKAK